MISKSWSVLRGGFFAGFVAFSIGSSQAATVVFGSADNWLNWVDTGSQSVTSSLQVTGAGTLTDIAFDPLGALYGISFSTLYRINTVTGAATVIGALTNTLAGNANALTFGTDGTLYASGNANPRLYTVNPGNGTTALVGNIGAGAIGSSGDLAFDASGNLFLTDTGSTLDRLYSLNPGTGAGALIGTNLGFDDMYGLAFADGTMWGGSGQGLYTINTSTGVAALVGAISGFKGSGSVIYGASAAVPIPPAFWLLGTAIAGAGFMARRRRSSGITTGSCRMGLD